MNQQLILLLPLLLFDMKPLPYLAGTTACSAATGFCSGGFTTWNPCQAWPQYNYPPCGVFLKVPKGQTVSPAGGFNIGLDMITSNEISCVLRKRSSRRHLLQTPMVGTTIDTTTPLVITTMDTTTPVVGTGVVDTPMVGTTVIDTPPIAMPSDTPIVGTGGDVPMVGTGGDVPVVGTGGDVPMVGTGGDTPIVITPPPTTDPTEPPTVDTPNDTTTDPTRPPVVYNGGPCKVAMKNMPVAGGCTCFKGQILTKLSNKAMRSANTGKGGAFARWKCMGLVPDAYSADACAGI
jgi:hypothetical protein